MEEFQLGPINLWIMGGFQTTNQQDIKICKQEGVLLLKDLLDLIDGQQLSKWTQHWQTKCKDMWEVAVEDMEVKIIFKLQRECLIKVWKYY